MEHTASRDVRFSISTPGADRVHHLSEDDIRIVLGRLPHEAWRRLRAVHFNDGSRGARVLGFVSRSRREITMCALPPRMSLTRFLVKGQSPRYWGAKRGTQWSALAIRRYLLYEVFLHELGHLQVVDPDARTERRKFAMEAKAEEFTALWRRRLWSVPFDHPDPVHGPPTEEERA